MTQYHFIASPKPLKIGAFGLNPISPDKPNVYATELDFAHLFMEKNYDEETKVTFSCSKHLKYKHQVAFMSNGIPLKGEKVNLNHPLAKKYMNILYSYILEAINDSGVIQYYTSINSEENLPLSSEREIRLVDLKIPEDLILADRELVIIVA